MGSFLTALVAVGVVLGFMILVHEFGHYAAAKLLGVRVEQFAIGFGKRLVGFRKGDTDYRINALPLGGYVKMSGENPMDSRTGDPGEFMSHPRWHRFLIAIAGPAMNIMLAIGLLASFWTGRALRALLVDVGERDPIALAGAAVVFATVALIASLGPAARAVRADPIEALRAD